MKIRPYLEADKTALIEILRSNTPDYFALEEEHDFNEYLDNAIESYFVAELDGKIVGCAGINYSTDKSIGILSWGMVHSDFHGRKIGKALLDYRISYLKSIPEVTKISVRTSQLVYKFFEKNGFQLLEIKNDYWAKGLDMYHMRYTE